VKGGWEISEVTSLLLCSSVMVIDSYEVLPGPLARDHPETGARLHCRRRMAPTASFTNGRGFCGAELGSPVSQCPKR